MFMISSAMKKRHSGWFGTIAILMGFVDVSIFITEGYGQNFSGSWYDAHIHCQSLGGSIAFAIDESNDGFSWTAYFQRHSMWIKLLGCYNEDHILINGRTAVFSLGMCQEYCTIRNKIIFGIQKSTCACIDKIPSAASQNPGKCNSDCGKIENMEMLPFNECGGQRTYNLYISGTEFENQQADTTRNTTCVAIQCGGDSKYLYENNCSFFYSRICQRNGSEALDKQSWQKSMEKCKVSDSPSYLRGDFSLENVTQTCAAYGGQHTGPSWIGIAIQIYLSFDKKGVEINQATPLRCQRCSRKGCHLVQNCSETAEYRCIGVPTTTQNTQSIEISKTIRNHSTTSVSKTKPIYTKNTPSSISKKRTSLKKITLAKPTLQTKVTIQTEASDAEKEPNIYILIPISVILPILLMVTLVMIIILRRRKCGEEDIVQIKELQQDDTNQYAQVDKTRNKENFTFEPQSKNPENLEVTKELRPNTLDIDKEDGVYDHLGESEFRGIIKEDTYDHASFVVVRGDCDYDNTQSIKRQEEESTYDHSMVIRSDG